MNYRLSRCFKALPNAALATALVGGVWAQPASAAPATRIAAGANLSGNPYYPLVLGAKWVYSYTESTGSTFTSTQTVAGTSTSAAGTQVSIHSSTSLEPGKILASTYTIANGGTVKVEGSSGSGSSTSSFSSTYWIPTASQIQTCSDCKFSGPFSASIEGQSLKGTLSETATAMGPHTVSVPAGTFSTAEVRMTIAMHGTGVMALSSSLHFNLFLAKNVGLVEDTGGSMAMTVMGHAIDTSLGTDKLVSYKP
ncbi:MAG TPA: hypothetical protein VL984_18265 [Acidimicrobiales bacterium]|nr:hypothetical protein [Acidimicrobiales bacterium]